MDEFLKFVSANPWLFSAVLGLLAVLCLFAIATLAVHWTDWGKNGSVHMTFRRDTTTDHEKTDR